jgi:hypothetical protein
MREEIIVALIAMINDNIGNKLTSALGTGIATALNQRIIELEAEKSAADQSAAETPGG